MKKVILIFILIFVSAFGFKLMGKDNSDSAAKSNSTMFTGYLSDIMCAELNNGVRTDGVNLKLHPEKHTVAWMKTLPSAMSGYGLFIKGNDNSYLFYRFDKKGTKLSKDLLKQTKKKEGITVKVTGEIKNNILCVESIQEI